MPNSSTGIHISLKYAALQSAWKRHQRFSHTLYMHEMFLSFLGLGFVPYMSLNTESNFWITEFRSPLCTNHSVTLPYLYWFLVIM